MRKINHFLAGADLIVANSEFMKRTLAEVLGLDAIVLTPEVVSPSDAQTEGNRDRILFFTPLVYKGAETAITLARELDSDRFLFVGKSRPKFVREFSRMHNVEYVPWTENVDTCYARSRLLIVPSVIPEGFGRVCVEAMARGIPCIGSGIGALPETIGAGGDLVTPHRDVSSWVKALNKYKSPEYYTEKSRRAIMESSKYSAFDIRGLVSAIDAVLDRRLRAPKIPS